MTRYRIVQVQRSEFVVQRRLRWWPFWHDSEGVAFPSIAAAEEWINKREAEEAFEPVVHEVRPRSGR